MPGDFSDGPDADVRKEFFGSGFVNPFAEVGDDFWAHITSRSYSGPLLRGSEISHLESTWFAALRVTSSKLDDSFLARTNAPNLSGSRFAEGSYRLREVVGYVRSWTQTQEFDFLSSTLLSTASPFVMLANAKRLLSQERVKDARDLLVDAAVRYPDDEQIADLLRAISPGRVEQKEGTMPDRKREVAWIRGNGQHYRGKWVAVLGDELVAVADDLKSLVADVNELGKLPTPPLIQRIVPEWQPPDA